MFQLSTAARMRVLVLALLTVTVWLGPAAADPVTDPTNGVIYTLTVPTDANGVPIPDLGTTSTYSATLTIDTSGFSLLPTGQAYLVAAAVKLAAGLVTDDPASIDAAPGGIGFWTPVYGPTAAGGCKENDEPDFVCAEAKTPGTIAPVPSLTDYIFTFNLELSSPLLALPTGSSVKAVYCDQDDKGGGCNVGGLTFLSQTSINVPTQGTNGSVPEPGTLILLGAGMLALVGSRRFVRR